MRRWGIIAILVLCLLLAGATACTPGGGTEEVSQQLVEVVRGDLTVTISGSGNIGVSSDQRLSFSSGGKIDRIYVEEGDEVNKGALLARLDTSTLELALSQAQLALDEAEYNLKQLKDVLHASHDLVKLAEAQLELAEQAVAENQKQLDEAVIIAPFSGTVTSIYAEEGDIVPSPAMAPQPVIYLTDPTTLELAAEVDEIDIPLVAEGQRATVEVDALPYALFEGEVTSIATLPSAQAGVIVYQAKIALAIPADSGIRLGMSATADIVTAERSDVLLVPSRAVTQDSQGNPMVRVLVNDEIVERAVVPGISDGIDTEIVSGLKEGETVVIIRTSQPSGTGLFG